jgi:hypothetical protein
MQINNITSPGNVWGAATRTLTADPATDAVAATLVWAHAARSLTTGIKTVTEVTARPSIAAGVVLDLRPAANFFRFVRVSGPDQAAGLTPGLYDGTNMDTDSLTGPTVSPMLTGGSTRGPAVKNNSGGALVDAYAGFDLGV